MMRDLDDGRNHLEPNHTLFPGDYSFGGRSDQVTMMVAAKLR